MHDSINVLGGELETCSLAPKTGWFRDGCCNTDARDRGSHTVCCILTQEVPRIRPLTGKRPDYTGS